MSKFEQEVLEALTIYEQLKHEADLKEDHSFSEKCKSEIQRLSNLFNYAEQMRIRNGKNSSNI